MVLPTEQPQHDEAWSRAKLDDRQAKLVVEKMNADLRRSNMKAAKLTGATLLREFLMQRWLDFRHTRARCGGLGVQTTISA